MANQITTPATRSELDQALDSLTPKQLAFVNAYRETGNAAEAYRRCYECSTWSIGAITAEAYRLKTHPMISLILGSAAEAAKEMAREAAPHSIMRLQERATVSEDAPAARQAVAVQADRAILEAAKLIGGGASVQVNVDARRIDASALDAWRNGGADAWRQRNAAPTDSNVVDQE